jgi:hypothetical protein
MAGKANGGWISFCKFLLWMLLLMSLPLALPGALVGIVFNISFWAALAYAGLGCVALFMLVLLAVMAHWELNRLAARRNK